MSIFCRPRSSIFCVFLPRYHSDTFNLSVSLLFIFIIYIIHTECTLHAIYHQMTGAHGLQHLWPA